MTEEQQKKFNSTLQNKTTTESHEEQTLFAIEANKILTELGQELGKETEGARHGKHIGSAAIHIYHAPATDTYFYVTQCHSTMNGVKETIASMASTEFQLELQKRYGRGPRKEKK